jgi:hypothetical protein
VWGDFTKIAMAIVVIGAVLFVIALGIAGIVGTNERGNDDDELEELPDDQ